MEMVALESLNLGDVLFVVAMVRIRGQSLAIHLYRLIHLTCSPLSFSLRILSHGI